MCGGTVVLYDAPVYDPPRIRAAIVDFGVNTLNHTPTGLLGLIEDGSPQTYAQMAGVRRLLILGEALRLDRFRRWPTHACPLGTALPDIVLPCATATPTAI